MRRATRSVLAALAALALLPGVALAHGFGNRYELSLPKWMFVGGGAVVVLVSFAVVSVFAGRDEDTFSYTARRIAATPLAVLTRPAVVTAGRALVVVLFALALASGLVGPREFNANLLTNLVWVGLWVGYTFSVILLGNTWPVLNPWKTVYEWVGAALGGEPSLDREYRLGSVPAFVLFLGFAWLEVVAPISRDPRGMAVIVLGYSAYLWGGMLVYGKTTWLTYADPFTRLYRYLGKFAPFSLDNGGELRMYGVGLVERDETLYTPGALAFLVAVLYTVTFDGFIATPLWRDVALAAPTLPVSHLTTTLLMVLGIALFVAAYLVFAWLMKLAAGVATDELALARRFALSLLPIAIVYQVSHFYTFLLVQGQFLALALADPFGRGWDLLGLGGFQPSAQIPFVSIQFVWQSQVALIVLGHIVAVWVAHHIALDAFEDRRTAIKSQIPMMALMVIYTMLSLWILTQPVIDPPLP